MKTFDEILFEKRNKEYGSYVLRKKYPKVLGYAMVIALFFFGTLIAYPVIASYLNKGKFSDKPKIEVGVEMMKPPVEDMTPPPPPPPVDIKPEVRFTAPVVVDEDVETTFATQDDLLNQKPSPVGETNDEIVIDEKKPQVIEPEPEREIFTVVEEQPIFNGDMYAYLYSNIKYPEEAKELGIQGKVFVTFVVERDGSITDVKVLRGIGGGCDEEAVRVVKSMPNWTPGKQRGNAVRVQFNLPIKFTLQ